MRIGIITRLLWNRYGPFWVKLLEEAGLEPVFPDEANLERTRRDPRLRTIPGRAFKEAAAQALALHRADVLLAPDLNPGPPVERGGGQDPFIASFPDALATTLSGLPPVSGVPAELDPELESVAIPLLQQFAHDPALVRRAWERHRARAKAPAYHEPRWQVRPGEQATVGVVGQPWLLVPELLAELPRGAEHVVSQDQLNPARLREEGWRAEKRLVPTDAEVLGAARLMGRRAHVARLEMVVDSDSGADAWLVKQVQKLLRKPLKLIYLDDLEISKAEG